MHSVYYTHVITTLLVWYCVPGNVWVILSVLVRCDSDVYEPDDINGVMCL